MGDRWPGSRDRGGGGRSVPAGAVRAGGAAGNGARADAERQGAGAGAAQRRADRCCDSTAGGRMSLAEQLAALRGRSAELVTTISSLSPDEWEQETNCPPWR